MAVVLFSGGCDSTLVLYQIAMNQLKQNVCGYVTAVSIEHDQVPAAKEQKRARELIKTEFLERQLPIEFIEVKIKHESGSIRNNYGLPQPPIWLSMSSLYVDKNDTVYLGYHDGDDYWHYKEHAEQAFKSFSKVQDKHDIKIEYPLEFQSKAEIITELKARGLYNLCWYCENPTIESTVCGTCNSCKTHLTALWQIEKFNKIPNPDNSAKILIDAINSPNIGPDITDPSEVKKILTPGS